MLRKGLVEKPRFPGQHADSDDDAGAPQFPNAFPRDKRVGILHPDDDGRNTRLDDLLRARRRLTLVAAWFEIDIERRPHRRFRTGTDCLYLCVTASEFPVIPFSDDPALLDDDRPYHGIRAHGSRPLPCEQETAGHIQCLKVAGCHREPRPMESVMESLTLARRTAAALPSRIDISMSALLPASRNGFFHAAAL